VRRDTRILIVVLGVLAVLAVQRHLIHISQETVLLLAVAIPSIILHEVSHGVVAMWFGDDTAQRAGRLTLNPIKHVDPFGTLILPALLTLSGHVAFGYAKPVPVNLARLRHPRNEGLLVSLAGPAVNLVLAVATVLWLRFVWHSQFLSLTSLSAGPLWVRVVALLGYVNVVLAALNLLPLPPLDGSALVERALPESWWPGWLKFRQFSMPLLIVIVLVNPRLLDKVFSPALNLWFRLVKG
jgi:Zn-dependent protease